MWLCVLCVFVVKSPATAAVVERILAVVDGRPVLLTEVQLLESLRGVARAEALEALIDERLMYREAARLTPGSLPASEEERGFASLRERAAALPPGAEGDLRRLAHRQTVILRYVDFRFRPQVRVTDEAVKQAYEAAYGSRPEAPALEAAAPALRGALESRALDEKIEAWVKELRAAADIRYNP